MTQETHPLCAYCLTCYEALNSQSIKEYSYKLVPIFYGEGDLEVSMRYLMKDQLVRSAKAELAAEKTEQERASVHVSR